jgi:hypothetical protein
MCFTLLNTLGHLNSGYTSKSSTLSDFYPASAKSSIEQTDLKENACITLTENIFTLVKM